VGRRSRARRPRVWGRRRRDRAARRLLAALGWPPPV